MSNFIQLHLLTSYPPANLNRDDLGRPKTAKMGGVDRLRVSSQSLKRAWRTSDLFQTALDGFIGTRTKELGRQIYARLVDAGIDEKNARKWGQAIAGVFGKPKSPNKKNPMDLVDLEIEQLAHVSPEEMNAVRSLTDTLISEHRDPSDEELRLLMKPRSAVDIALFGRMLAADPNYNVEAACQVAHSISVHPVMIEDDYFTAVDDLNTGEEDRGAAHIGETGFASALFYSYVCINKTQLVESLGGDEDLANRAIAALIETAAKVGPTGKQNSFASRAYASYVMVEKGEVQPRSLSLAFLKPIQGDNFGEDSVNAFISTYTNMDTVYETNGRISREALNVLTGEGKLSKLIAFAQE